jgi:hypothetical protein
VVSGTVLAAGAVVTGALAVGGTATPPAVTGEFGAAVDAVVAPTVVGELGDTIPIRARPPPGQ